jgi:hypothetical protein
MFADEPAVVADEDHQGVASQAAPREVIENAADVGIRGADHRVILGDASARRFRGCFKIYTVQIAVALGARLGG